MTPELKEQKLERFLVAWEKLSELRKAEPAGDLSAQNRAAAGLVTTATGIARPLADRYITQIAPLLQQHPDFTREQARALISDEIINTVTALDDKFGASFMVLPHHVDQILKGGKHMSRRFRRWGDPGDVFHVRGKAFRFNRVQQLRVGDITEDDIRKEGYTNKEEFEQMWYKSHPKTVSSGKKLEPDQVCWCHEYEPA
jgi:N4-acetylcytidine amidohydrolase